MNTHSSYKEIFRLAIPNIISNITIPLLSLVDVGLAGHMPHTEAIGAISVATTVTNTLFWLFGFLRLSSTGFTAQALGKHDARGIQTTLARGLMLASLSTLIIFFLSPLIFAFSGIVAHHQAEISRDAQLYLTIILLSSPAVMFSYVFNGWFVGMQNTRIPMIGAIFSNVMNILLSSALVILGNRGIEGIALGSVLAQYLTFILLCSMAYLRYKKYIRGMNRSHFALSSDLKRYLIVGRDLFFRSALLSGITLFFTYASTSMGTRTIAINTLLMQLFLIFSYFMDGFAYAGEALIGKYAGMERKDKIREVVHRLFIIGILFALLFAGLYSLGLHRILSILSDKSDVIAYAQKFSLWISLIPLCGFSAFLWDGILVGLTRAQELMLSMLIAVALFFLSYTTLVPGWGAAALWFSFDLYLLTRSIVQFALWHSRLRPLWK